MSDFWITTNDLATAINVEDQTIRKRILQNQYKIIETPSPVGGGQAGMQKLIDFYSLPEEEQTLYLRYWGRNTTSTPEQAIPVDILKYQDEAGQLELEKVLLRIRACQEITALEEQRLTNKAMRPYIEKWLNRLNISRTHLRRLMNRYEAEGASALFRPERKDKGSRRSFCEAAKSLLKYIYLSEKKLSCKMAFEFALQEAAGRDDGYCAYCICGKDCTVKDKSGLKLGSYSSAHRIISELNPAEVAMYRGGREAWRKNFMIKARIRRDDMPVNGQWVGDHHVMDFYACDDEGRVGRPWLTAWQDRRSGAIVGCAYSFNPNSSTIAAALVHGMKKKPGVPFSGRPETILIDNGRDYRSKFLNGSPKNAVEETPETYRRNCEGLFQQLGIEVHFARAYTPWSKPIERFFGTFADRFSRNQPSWLGRNANERPATWQREVKKLIAEGKIPTLETVKEETEKFLDWYHGKEQESLNSSPIEVYNTAPKFEGAIPTDRALAFLLMNQVERKIFPTGIQINNRFYANESKLALYVGQTAQIRFDPMHPEEVYVCVDKQFICTAALRVDLSLREEKDSVSQHIANQRSAEKEIKSRYKEYGIKAGKPNRKKVIVGATLPSTENKVVTITGLEKIPVREKSNLIKLEAPQKKAESIDPFRSMLRDRAMAAQKRAQERRQTALGQTN